MSASKDLLDDQDPDYTCPVLNNKKDKEVCEENARATAQKITAIIEKEFSLEIESKKNEILQIQERLHKALKTLHLLRYAIITDFYNRKQCQASQAREKQVCIHPAVKRLIGKAPKRTWDDAAVPSTSTDSSQCKLYFSPEKKATNGEPFEASSKGNDRSLVDVSQQNHNAGEKHTSESASKPKKIPRYVPPKSGLPESTSPSRGVRHKVRKRIVVGNISKWIPPEWREDAASHKWTVYVRGTKEASYIGDFVSKVRFFLHPSYRPNDLVEVSSPPFHLSRRGWGEFPLRVQLHFKNPTNKPMDIIHNLKLDRTYTGLQTLGSETVVDVWIHTNEPRSFLQDAPDNSSENYETNEKKDVDMILKNMKTEKRNLSNEFAEVTVKKEKSEVAISETNRIDLRRSSSSMVSHKVFSNASNNDIFPVTTNNVASCQHSNKDNGTATLEQIKLYIRHDHNYLGDNFVDKNHFHEEKNITIEHKTEEDSTEENDKSESTKQTNVNPSKNSVPLLDTKSTLRPLQISIPPTFETPTGKLMLVVRSNKKTEIGNVGCIKVAGTNDTYNRLGNPKSSGTFIPGGTSLLKRSLLKTSNTVLIDLNSDVPVLKIADGYTNNFNNHVVRQSKEKSSAFDATDENGGKPIKPRVVVGKDKFKIHSKQDRYEEILRSIDEVTISDVEGTIRFIIRRLPIVTSLAADPDYKRLHPYSCSSEEEFFNYNVGKRASHEWYRAKAIRDFLKKKSFAEDSVWSVKEILIWARLHGYTPVRTPFFLNPSITANGAKRLPCSIVSTYTEPLELHRWIESCRQMSQNRISLDLDNSQEEEIDVLTVQKTDKLSKNMKLEGDKETSRSIFLEIDEKSIPLHTFVCETARSIGVKLLPQEIVPNVMHCTASCLLTKVTECLVEDLLRKSLAKAWERSNEKEFPQLVSLDDVRAAIASREEFDVFTNEGLGSRLHPAAVD